MTTKKSVAFIYGFAEGKWHGKRFRKLLRHEGYRIIKDPRRADIVITHSAGSFYIPHLRPAQTLLMINPPYWPGKTLGVRGKEKLRQDIQAIRPGNQLFFHINKTAHNIWYIVHYARRVSYIAKAARLFSLQEETTHKKTILIRNQGDPWLTPDIQKLRQVNPQLQIHNLPGEHDDCWLNPEPYVRLLQSDT